MSIDYPDRTKWLARRSTPRKRPGRYIHVSKPLVVVLLPTPHLEVTKEPGVTYRKFPFTKR